MKMLNKLVVLGLALVIVVLLWSVLAANSGRPVRGTAPAPTQLAAYPAPPAPVPEQTMAPRPTLPPPPTLMPEPTRTPLPPTPVAESRDIAAIVAVVKRSYDLQALAARNFDTSQFHEVYVNDPRTPLDQSQQAYIQKMLPVLKGYVPEPAGTPGMLDYWRLKFAEWRLGAERWEQQQRGVAVSATDGIVLRPALTGNPPPQDIRFDGTWVTGDRAEALVDTGGALRRLYLVKTAEGWRIGGQQILDTHF